MTIKQGRDEYLRLHTRPAEREYTAADVKAGGLSRGRVLYAAGRRNKTARAALRDARGPDAPTFDDAA